LKSPIGALDLGRSVRLRARGSINSSRGPLRRSAAKIGQRALEVGRAASEIGYGFTQFIALDDRQREDDQEENQDDVPNPRPRSSRVSQASAARFQSVFLSIFLRFFIS
jgi:hypothetical protein